MPARALLPRLGLLTAAALLLVFALPAAAARTEQDCLREYLESRKSLPKALRTLRSCAAEHPDSAVIQLTLGRRLLREMEAGTLGEDPRAEALAALEAAARVDPDQVGEDWLRIADLRQQAGKTGVLEALARADIYLDREQREATQDRRWDLALELGADAEALAAWEEIRFRRTDDLEAQLTAAALLARAGRRDAARACYERALTLRPGEPRAGTALCRILLAGASQASSGDRKQMLDLCEPIFPDLEDDELALLLEAATQVFRSEQAERLAALLRQRRSGDGLADLVEAERALVDLKSLGRFDASRGHGRAIQGARRALRRGLSGERAARAHAVLGTALSYRAHAAYARSGREADRALQSRTLSAYHEALAELQRAERLGASVGGQADELRRAIARLGGMGLALDAAELDAARAACESLDLDARRGHETDRPVLRRTRFELSLEARPGGGGEPLAGLAAGAQVRLLEAQWAEQACWVRVKAEDGRSGWLANASLQR